MHREERRIFCWIKDAETFFLVQTSSPRASHTHPQIPACMAEVKDLDTLQKYVCSSRKDTFQKWYEVTSRGPLKYKELHIILGSSRTMRRLLYNKEKMLLCRQKFALLNWKDWKEIERNWKENISNTKVYTP